MKLRDVLGVLRDSYCRTVGIELHPHPGPGGAPVDPGAGGDPHEKPDSAVQKYILSKLKRPRPSRRLQTKYVGQKRFSLEGGETVIPLLDTILDKAAEYELDEVVVACRTAAG